MLRCTLFVSRPVWWSGCWTDGGTLLQRCGRSRALHTAVGRGDAATVASSISLYGSAVMHQSQRHRLSQLSRDMQGTRGGYGCGWRQTAASRSQQGDRLCVTMRVH